MCGFELGLSNSSPRLRCSPCHLSHDVWTLHVCETMKLRNKLSGTHRINMFHPDSELQERLLSVGGTGFAGWLHMLRWVGWGGGGSSTCKSGSISPLTALRQEKKGRKKKNPRVNKITSPDLCCACCSAAKKKSEVCLCFPHHPLSHRLGGVCQKTCRTSTAGAPSSRHTSPILLRSGRSGLRADQGMRTNSGCLFWEGRLVWTSCTLQRLNCAGGAFTSTSKTSRCGQCVNYRISLRKFYGLFYN